MSTRLTLTLALLLVAAPAAAQAQTPAPRPATSDSARCACQQTGDCPMHQMGGMHKMGGMQRMGMGAMGNMGGMGGMNRQEMPMPSAADNARLDSLVTTMHKAKGDRKLAAMEKVIDELLAHRRAMQEHMQKMRDGAMKGPGARGVCLVPADSADHGQHQ